MGSNKWQSSEVWPPADAKPVTYYLGSGGRANSLNGDGVLATDMPGKDAADKFTYDPMNPVPTHGGGFCCMGAAYQPARSISAVRRCAMMCWCTARGR